jgi:energy-converting hydrogenase Eha subunit H
MIHEHYITYSIQLALTLADIVPVCGPMCVCAFINTLNVLLVNLDEISTPTVYVEIKRLRANLKRYVM